MIERKAEGKEIVASDAEAPKATKTPDLMAALEASIAAVGGRKDTAKSKPKAKSASKSSSTSRKKAPTKAPPKAKAKAKKSPVKRAKAKSK